MHKSSSLEDNAKDDVSLTYSTASVWMTLSKVTNDNGTKDPSGVKKATDIKQEVKEQCLILNRPTSNKNYTLKDDYCVNQVDQPIPFKIVSTMAAEVVDIAQV